MSFALAATLHDVVGALDADVRALLPVLRDLYPAGVCVATSPPTAASTRRLLEDADVHAGSPRANERGPLYRRSLARAVASGADRVHYLDFDRALHYASTMRAEYAALLRLAARHDVLLVGRTERAHRSHQRPLYATELIANRVMCDRLGWTGRVDFLVPSFVLPREQAMRLTKASRARNETMYGEWAVLVATSAPTIAYVECRGLDWETPDRHRADVEATGLDAFRDAQDTPEEWTMRRRLAEAVVRGFDRARPSGVDPTLTRLRPPVGRET